MLYNQPLEVTVAVDADPTRNVYKYSCATADGLSSENGGEMEIVR